MVVLGMLFVLMGIFSDGVWALLAGTAGSWLKGHMGFLRAQRYFSGSVFIALGDRVQCDRLTAPVMAVERRKHGMRGEEAVHITQSLAARRGLQGEAPAGTLVVRSATGRRAESDSAVEASAGALALLREGILEPFPGP